MTECGICNLSFSGNQDLHTHYLGDSHRDRAGKVNHWNCAICLTATTGIEPFHQHLSGQAHLKRVGGAPRVGYAVVPQALSPPDQYRCSVCHKGISGTPNYRQHIEGTGHGAAMSRLSLLRCQPCQESFSSIQEMNAHLLYSPEHMKEMRRGMREEEENQATKWEEPMDTGEGLVTDECAMDESISEDYYVCIVCKSAKLQGSLEYKKHLEQLAHRIAVSAPGSLNCVWCEETFVDVGDMNRHLLEDEMHLLNMRAFIGSTVNEAKSTGTERVGVITDGPAAADAGVVELKAFDPSELAIIPLTSPSEQYLCSVCGDQLVSGNPNYTQHLDGGKHRKKALGSRDGLKCSWCNIAFESAEDQRQHLVRSNGHFQQMAQRLQMRARGGLIGASSAMDLSFKSTPGLVTDGAFSTGKMQGE